jgi:hypothetical protein
MKPMRGSSSRVTVVAITGVAVTALATALAAFSLSNPDPASAADDNPGACESQSVDDPGQGCAKALVRLFEQGKAVFRFDTFGDEDYWGGKLELHKAIAGAALGGVGPGVSPKTALTAAGLKVDVDALPGNLQAKLKQGKVDLDSPATTLALLELNAVVGVKGVFDKGGSLSSVGITCALCHSTVDDSFAPGIGKRLDGWPNQDLNVGLIVSLAPNLAPMADQVLGASDPATIDTLKKVLLSWGPGFYDAEVNIDAIGFRPDGKSAAVRIPAAYGHLGEDLHTWTGGFGNVTYWNAYVANLQMHGNGNFNDERFNDPAKYPAAVRGGFFRLRHNPDQVTSKLAPLHYYQLSLKAPTRPSCASTPSRPTVGRRGRSAAPWSRRSSAASGRGRSAASSTTAVSRRSWMWPITTMPVSTSVSRHLRRAIWSSFSRVARQEVVDRRNAAERDASAAFSLDPVRVARPEHLLPEDH